MAGMGRVGRTSVVGMRMERCMEMGLKMLLVGGYRVVLDLQRQIIVLLV
jgi:hypothetical protein